MFSEADRSIYEWVTTDAAGSPVVRGRFDPLGVRRGLILATGNRLNGLIDAYCGVDAAGVPVDPDPVAEMRAEEALVAAARQAFALPDRNSALDAEVIELLWDFLDFLGKPPATVVGSPNTSPSSVVQAG